MLLRIWKNFKRYTFLMNQMVSRDFKVKYKRSVLGILWSLLFPLLQMSVMAVVFSQMFRFRMEGINYLVYLMTGLVIFNYFSEASNTAMTSLVTNFQLMKKVYIPKYIFPLSKCIFATINFLLTLIPLLLIILFSGDANTHCTLNIYYLFLPFAYLCVFLFAVGVGFILSTISVFLRDIFYIYGIMLTMWQYFTPTFYDIKMLTPGLQKLFYLNPLYHYIDFTRTIILYNTMPSLNNWLWCGGTAIFFFFVGCIVFKAKQDKFIYYA